MKKTESYCFLILGLLLCVCPLAGMTFARTEETTEKKELAALPAFLEDGKWNGDFLQELGRYFEDHFAFRQYFVSMDSWLESLLFQKTNIDNVIIGKDGWLFYKDTLNDYTGKEIMSERALDNIVYNLSVMQEEIEAQEKKFVFTIAPNKNSLYEQGMPYTCSYKYSDTNNRKLLEEKLQKAGINYVDLYQQFKNQKEILYFKRDSHWNNKGALLAYNSLLDAAGWEHADYADCMYSVKKDYIGDLNSMVYPGMEKTEENYYYNYETLYQYVDRGNYEDVEESSVSVEDARVQTCNSSGEGALVMYRDSFGNTLLPFMANAFRDGYFFKTTPYNIGTHLESSDPDVVIVEKVERKLDELAVTPAVMTGKEVVLPEKYRTVKTNTTLSAVIPEANAGYYEIYGVLDEAVAASANAIYVQFEVKDGERITCQAFARTIEGVSDYGYVAYIPKDLTAKKNMEVNVYVEREDGVFCVKNTKVDITTVKQEEDRITQKDIPESTPKVKRNTNGMEVTILEKGREKVIYTQAETLQEMEELGEIVIHNADRIIPDTTDKLLNGEIVSIQRVVVKEKKVVKEIPYQTKGVFSDELYEGEQKVTTEGEKGEKTIVYRITYVDGKLEKKEKISEDITKNAVNKVITIGTKKKIMRTSPPPVATKSPDKSNKRTIVSKEWVEDCGSNSGYYIITYSDGTVEYVEG